MSLHKLTCFTSNLLSITEPWAFCLVLTLLFCSYLCKVVLLFISSLHRKYIIFVQTAGQKGDQFEGWCLIADDINELCTKVITFVHPYFVILTKRKRGWKKIFGTHSLKSNYKSYLNIGFSMLIGLQVHSIDFYHICIV